MKTKRTLKSILSALWTDFPVPAVICALLVVLSPFNSLAGYADPPNPLRDTLLQLESGLMLALTLSTLMSLLPLRSVMRHALAIVGAAVGVIVSLMDLQDLYMGLLAASALLCPFFACGKKDQEFRLNQVLGWFFVCLGIGLVTYFALSLVTGAARALFFPHMSWKVDSAISSTVMMLSLLLVAPWLFLGGLPRPEDPTDVRCIFRTFVSKVLLPLSLLLMAVLLLYVAQIAITLTMPVGVMNGLGLTALSLYCFFHLTLTGEEGALPRFFKRWGAWLMLPVLVVQQIGVWIRIGAYGVTELRVAGLVITALLTAVMICGLIRKRAVWFFPAAAVLAFVFIATPLNCGNIAWQDQSTRLTAALERCSMLDEEGAIVANPDAPLAEREIIWSASGYLLSVHRTIDPSETVVQLRRQMFAASEADPATPEPDHTEYHYYGSAPRARVLGFTNPTAQSSYISLDYVGTASQVSLDVRGFDHVEYIHSNAAVSSDSAAAEGLTNWVCTDIQAIADALRAGDLATFVFPETPMVLYVNGESVDLQPILTSAGAASPSATLNEAERPLTTDRVTLPSGKVLYIDRIRLHSGTYSDDTRYVSFYVSAWVMTPTQP